MSNPLVSIIIPVYNGSNYLAESIESALGQTYKNIEVIVVNDGSNDDTEKIALSYGDKIRYFYKKNGGVSSALNYGIKQMSGELFSWLSHDDLYYSNKVKEQVQTIIDMKNDKSIIMSTSELIDEKGNLISFHKKYKKKIYNGNQMFKTLFNGTSINGCSLLIPKEALVRAGYFDETLKYIQDWKMWVMLALDDYSFIYIDKPLVRMRIHSNQQTIRIKDLLPKESDSFTLELLDKLMEETPKNKEKVMLMIFWGIRSHKPEVINKSLNLLKKSNNFNLRDKVSFYSYYPIGFAIGKIKRLIRKYLDVKRRRLS